MFDAAFGGGKRLQAVGERVLVAGQQRASIAAVIVELRECGWRRVVRRRGVGCRLPRRNFRRVRFFAVENSGDVGDGARRRDKAWLDRGAGCRRRSGVDFGRRRRRRSDSLFLFLANHARPDQRRTASGANRFGIALETLGLRAGLDLRAHGLPACFHDLIVAGGECGQERHDGSERGGAAQCGEAAQSVHADSHVVVASVAPVAPGDCRSRRFIQQVVQNSATHCSPQQKPRFLRSSACRPPQDLDPVPEVGHTIVIWPRQKT